MDVQFFSLGMILLGAPDWRRAADDRTRVALCALRQRIEQEENQ